MISSPIGAESPTLTPTPPSERIVVIDAMRGFALLGILLVNMELFAHPVQTLILPQDPAMSVLDRLAAWLVRFFAEGKFYSLFSLLFGLGFGMQMLRAAERGKALGLTRARRLLALVIIGIIHATLVWVGDILVMYALLGFALLLWRKAKPRTLLIWAVVLLALPPLFNTLGAVGIEMGRSAGPRVAEQLDRAFAQQDSVFHAQIDQAYRVYSDGDFGEVTAQRVGDLGFVAFGYLFMSPGILAMFLLGLYAARRGLFTDLEGNLPFFRKLFWWGLGLGFVGNFVFATLIPQVSRAQPSFTLLGAMAGQAVGAPAFALCYAGAIVLLWRRTSWISRLSSLAAVGRLPLSNYLAQSLICTVLFYGYGFGLFGEVGKAAGVLLTIVIYAVLVSLSIWWTRRYPFGPVEWLWRSATYLQWPQMRRG